MKSAAQILKELGFNPDSSMGVQKAFFKHLAQQADANQAKREEKPQTKVKSEPVQLEFNFDDKKRVS
jgi:hypothetical protein